MHKDVSALQHNLGVGQQLLNAGRIQEAHALLTKILQENPDEAEAYNLMASVMLAARQPQEAVAALRRAITLAPSTAYYHENLGVVLMLSQDGAQIAEAFDCFQAALRLDALAYKSAFYMMMLGLRRDAHDIIVPFLQSLLTEGALADEQRLLLNAGCAVALYLGGDFLAAAKHAKQATALRAAAFDADGRPYRPDASHMFIFAQLVERLAAFHAAHPSLYAGDTEAELHVVGESHCLAPAHLVLATAKGKYRVRPHMVMGAKAYFFSVKEGAAWQYQLQQLVQTIPSSAPVVFCFGEIDCRANEGIMEQRRKNPEMDIRQNVTALAHGYVGFVAGVQKERQGMAWIAGVPAPTHQAAQTYGLEPEYHAVFLEMIGMFNDALRQEAAANGMGFMDLYTKTASPSGWARENAHIDDVHLTPQAILEAMNAELF